MKYILITDGAYSPIRDQGGLAFVFLRDSKLILEYSKQFKNVTNNQMELLAIIIGFKCIKNPIKSLLVVSDSMYCIGTITLNWKRKKNQKLWTLFDREYSRIKSLCNNIEFKHVRGHQKDDSTFTKWNNYVDRLAVSKSQELVL